jgi:hypothetical protein
MVRRCPAPKIAVPSIAETEVLLIASARDTMVGAILFLELIWRPAVPNVAEPVVYHSRRRTTAVRVRKLWHAGSLAQAVRVGGRQDRCDFRAAPEKSRIKEFQRQGFAGISGVSFMKNDLQIQQDVGRWHYAGYSPATRKLRPL